MLCELNDRVRVVDQSFGQAIVVVSILCYFGGSLDLIAFE
jgi:hypothetical protein